MKLSIVPSEKYPRHELEVNDWVAKEKEYDLKVLKGEAEPKRIAPWTKSRPSSETSITAFLEVA